jgi:PadR family transcriptional regulator
MANRKNPRAPLLPGTLDLIVLRTLAAMGAMHAYAIATRLEQVSGKSLILNQGTLYPALVRLEQRRLIKGTWGRTGNNRDAKFYTLTRLGEQALAGEVARWREVSGLVEKLLLEE